MVGSSFLLNTLDWVSLCWSPGVAVKVVLPVPNNYLHAGNSLLAQNFLHGEGKLIFSCSSKSW